MFRRKKKETALQKSQREQDEYQQNLEKVRKQRGGPPPVVNGTSSRRRTSSASDAEDKRPAARETAPPTFAAARGGTQSTRRPPQSHGQGQAPLQQRGGSTTLPNPRSARPLPAPPPGGVPPGQEALYGDIDDPPSAATASGEVVYGEIDFEGGAGGDSGGGGGGGIVYQAAPAPASGQVVYGSIDDATAPQSGEVVYGAAPPTAASGEVVYGAAPSNDGVGVEGEDTGVQALYATLAPKRGNDTAAPAPGVAPRSPPPRADAVYAAVAPKLNRKPSSNSIDVPPPIHNRHPAEDEGFSAPSSSPTNKKAPSPVPSPVKPAASRAVDPDPYSLPSSVNAEAAAERRAVDAWLRSPIDRGQAQTCLHKAGLQNGAYLVRKSTEGTFGLSIVSHKTIFHMKIMSELDRAGQNMYFIQGDQELGSSFPSVWELLMHYKTPTGRLTWHLVSCISETFIP
eukprot:m.448942 g.448942  ORF g.448942 m.448942 type:complete len:455 (-) comp19742_c0_seq1:157-1521(-)